MPETSAPAPESTSQQGRDPAMGPEFVDPNPSPAEVSVADTPVVPAGNGLSGSRQTGTVTTESGHQVDHFVDKDGAKIVQNVTDRYDRVEDAYAARGLDLNGNPLAPAQEPVSEPRKHWWNGLFGKKK